MDEFVKSFLNERYRHVVARLKEYSEAIEEMVEELFKAETIEGKKVREIIRNFEERHGLPSKLAPEPSDIEAELKNGSDISSNKDGESGASNDSKEG